MFFTYLHAIPSLIHKYQNTPEKLAQFEHASLFCRNISDEEKNVLLHGQKFAELFSLSELYYPS